MIKRRTIKTIPKTRTPERELTLQERLGGFAEVGCGYTREQALNEAQRCLMCGKPECVAACPVNIDIPAFLREIEAQRFRAAYEIISESNMLPAICGRICPQERKCEGVCTVGKKLEPVAIGRLERWVGDMALAEGWSPRPHIEPSVFRVGIVGSGPAGLACAADLAKAGCGVTVFEARREPGGVLRHGIPEFRLPNAVVDAEIARLRELGVKFQCGVQVGEQFTIEQMIGELGFDAVFIGTGAGSPSTLGVPGETLNGVLPASGLLARCNPMAGQRLPASEGLPASEALPAFDGPTPQGRRVTVIGAGDGAMDAVRACLRLGAREVHCLYRRSRTECPARAEDIRRAEEEGARFHWLTSPVEILDDGAGGVRGLRCVRMELGEPDASGRRTAVAASGGEFLFDADLVAVAIGATPNPVIGQTSKLRLDKRGFIQTDGALATSMAGVFAGGGAAGVVGIVEAMGAGRKAARSVKAYLGLRDAGESYANGAGKLFGLDIRQRNFARVRVA